MNGWWSRVAGAERQCAPAAHGGRFWAALNFTVRPHFLSAAIRHRNNTVRTS